MRVLVLSRAPWADSNNFGSTFSSIFEGIEGLEFANVYCASGRPDNGIVGRYFQITEQSLLRNLVNRAVPSGHAFRDSDASNTGAATSGVLEARALLPWYEFAKTKRWQPFLWIRDLVWASGRWDSPELAAFIEEYDPDLLFQPIYYSGYLSDMALAIQERTGAPMVGYVSDDVYTLRQFALSPFYWIDRLLKRRRIRRVIDRCKLLFVISDVQKSEYERLFAPRCEVLTKCSDFDSPPDLVTGIAVAGQYRRPLEFLYVGNISTARWKTLGLLAAAIRRINSRGGDMRLTIHTATPVTRAMRRALDVPGASRLLGSIATSEVRRLQAAADVLVHAEGFDLKSRLQVRHSFSTKLVDYFASGRCILAVGPEGVASIEYLRANDAALVASSRAQLDDLLMDIHSKPSLLEDYALKGWATGKRNHNRPDVQRRLIGELRRVAAVTGRCR